MFRWLLVAVVWTQVWTDGASGQTSTRLEMPVIGKDEQPVIDIMSKYFQHVTDIGAMPDQPGWQRLVTSGGSDVKWTLCNVQPGTKSIQVDFTWKPDHIGSRSMETYIGKENVAFSDGDTWKVMPNKLSFRSPTWPTGHLFGALVIEGLDNAQATAFVSKRCLQSVETTASYLTKLGGTTFTKCAEFRLKRDMAYLYIRQQKPLEIGKTVRLRLMTAASRSDVDTHLKNEGCVPEPEETTSGSRQSAGQPSVVLQMGGASSGRPAEDSAGGASVESVAALSAALAGGPQAPSDSSHRSGDITSTASVNGNTSARVSDSSHGSGDIRNTASVDGNTFARVSDSSHSSGDITHTGPVNGNTFNVYLSRDDAAPAPAPAPAPAAAAQSQAERQPDPQSQWDDQHDQPLPVGRKEAGSVSRLQPRTLLFSLPHSEAQAGPLRFELNATAPMDAILHVGSRLLTLHSAGIGSVRENVCSDSRQLKATIITNEKQAKFSVQLLRPDSLLRLGEVAELALTGRRPAVKPIVFPDWTTDVSLKTDLAPGQCVRLGVFRRMCDAVAGPQVLGDVFKYVSGRDYMPLPRGLFNLTAFVRAAWAPPQRCGLAAPSGPASARLHALLSIVSHELDAAWTALLAPALTAALCPLLVVLVRRLLAGRSPRGSEDPDGGVQIEEVQSTPWYSGNGSQRVALPPPSPSPSALPIAPAAHATAASAAVTPPPPPRTVLAEAGYADLAEQKRQATCLPSEASAPATSDDRRAVQSPTAPPNYPDLTEHKRQVAAEQGLLDATTEQGLLDAAAERGLLDAAADDPLLSDKRRLAVEMGVGGPPASPSAPQLAPPPEASLGLMSLPDRTVSGRATSHRTGLDHTASDRTAAPPAHPDRNTALTIACWSAPLLASTLYGSLTLLQEFWSGNVGVCSTSPAYSLPSAALPSVSGLVCLVPAASFAVTVRVVRRAWRRTAASQCTAAAVWPTVGVEWLIVSYAVHTAITGLCPRPATLFATNTSVVALLASLAAGRLPLPGHRALPAVLAGSALVSASRWLPAPWGSVAAAATGLAHLAAACHLQRLLVLPDRLGSLSALRQMRLLVWSLPRYTLTVCLANVAVAVAGGLWLSADGYLGLFGAANLAAVLFATRRTKSTGSKRRPPSYADMALPAGSVVLLAALTTGELAKFGLVEWSDVTAINGVLYLIGMLLLTLGVQPMH